MDKMKLDTAWKIMLVTVLGGTISYFALKYILPVAIPFIVAYGVAALTRPVSARMKKRSPHLDKAASVVTVTLILALTLWGVYSLSSLLVTQLSGLISGISSDLGEADNPIRRAVDFFVNIRDRIPFLSESTDGAERIYEILTRIAENALSKLTSAITDVAAALVSSLPSFAITLVVAVSATFYFSLDRGSLGISLAEFFPKNTVSSLVSLKKKITGAMLGYLKSYLVMMLIVFAQLYLGLTLVGVKYSFVLALIIAFVDLLPVLGVGTVLVPWSIVSVIIGDSRTGIGLAVIFAVITVVRQLLEPRIIGSCIGIHPILALASVYLGMKLFGIAGLIFAPIVLYIARSIIA